MDATTTQPGKGSLHYPTLRQDLEPLLLGVAADNLQHVPAVVADPLVQGVVVVLVVRPQLLQPGQLLVVQFRQYLGRRRAVVHARPGHQHGQDHAQGIHHDMPLATSDLLAGVVALGTARPGRLDALAVDAAGTRRRFTARLAADLPDQGVMDLLPRAVLDPGAEVVVDGSPGREVMRQGPPANAVAVAVEQGVDDLPHVGFSVAPAGARRWNQGLQESPLLVT